MIVYWYKEYPRDEWSLFVFPVFWTGAMSYGTVDELPGQLHVATRFFHLFGIPLIPLGSYVLDVRTGEGFPLRLRFKSIAFAWMRCALLLAALASVVIAIGGISLLAHERDRSPLAAVLVAVATIVAAIVAFRILGVWQLASPERAAQLAEVLGYSGDAAAADAEHRDALFAPLDETRCVRCGRPLAASTRTCPRCETRQW